MTFSLVLFKTKKTSSWLILRGIPLVSKIKGKSKKKVPDNFKFYLKKYLLRSAAFPYSLKQFKEDTKLKQGVLYRFINEFKEETINSIKKQSLNL